MEEDTFAFSVISSDSEESMRVQGLELVLSTKNTFPKTKQTAGD